MAWIIYGPSLTFLPSPPSGISLQPLDYKQLTTSRTFVAVRIKEFPLAPMGVLAPGYAHTRPSAQPPINNSGNFPTHMSVESPSKISPNSSEVISEVSEP